MADRREQLREAYAEVEEVEDDEKEKSGAGDDSGGADEGKASDDTGGADEGKSKLGTGEGDGESGGTEEADDDKTHAKDDGKGIQKGGKKSATGSDSGKSVGGKAASKIPPKSDAPKGAKDDAAKASEADERAAAVGEAPKAWRPVERETWANIPKEAREAIQRRETEITQFIGRHGAAIQHKAQFDEIVQPFMSFIVAQQSTPMKAFHGLMTTAARLTTSAPQQKAVVIAEIMENYGVDVRTLDEVLSARQSGRPVNQSGASPVNQGPPEWAKPIFNFMQETQQARQAREQRIQQEAAAELEKFEAKPFFHDLREDIGLLMQRAASKGRVLTMEQAYEQARKMNSEIDTILTQRERAASTANGGSSIERARRAASTIKGSPIGAAAGAAVVAKKGDQKMTRRETIQAAIDAARED